MSAFDFLSDAALGANLLSLRSVLPFKQKNVIIRFDDIFALRITYGYFLIEFLFFFGLKFATLEIFKQFVKVFV